jgi:hypothetical protein
MLVRRDGSARSLVAAVCELWWQAEAVAEEQTWRVKLSRALLRVLDLDSGFQTLVELFAETHPQNQVHV